MRYVALLLTACTSHLPPEHPCNLEANPRAHVFLAACAARIAAECDPDPAVPCEVEQECEREWARRCEQVQP